MSFLKESEYHQKQADYYKRLHEDETYLKSLISLGAYIMDTDTNKVAKVEGLKNGCIDFSADYLDRSYSRGYNFVAGNWRLATAEEIDQAQTNPQYNTN